jgi:hypothetical protein
MSLVPLSCKFRPSGDNASSSISKLWLDEALGVVAIAAKRSLRDIVRVADAGIEGGGIATALGTLARGMVSEGRGLVGVDGALDPTVSVCAPIPVFALVVEDSSGTDIEVGNAEGGRFRPALVGACRRSFALIPTYRDAIEPVVIALEVASFRASDGVFGLGSPPISPGVVRPLDNDDTTRLEGVTRPDEDGVERPRRVDTEGGRGRGAEITVGADKRVDGTKTPQLGGHEKYCFLFSKRVHQQQNQKVTFEREKCKNSMAMGSEAHIQSRTFQNKRRANAWRVGTTLFYVLLQCPEPFFDTASKDRITHPLKLPSFFPLPAKPPLNSTPAQRPGLPSISPRNLNVPSNPSDSTRTLSPISNGLPVLLILLPVISD